jgi:hypothetical protein
MKNIVFSFIIIGLLMNGCTSKSEQPSYAGLTLGDKFDIESNNNDFFNIQDIQRTQHMGHVIMLAQFYSLYGFNKNNTFCKIELHGDSGDYICLETNNQKINRMAFFKVYSRTDNIDTPEKVEPDFQNKVQQLQKKYGNFSCKTKDNIPLTATIKMNSFRMLTVIAQCQSKNTNPNVNIFVDANQGGGDIVTIFSL